jgi:Fe-S-cluster containining protein
VTDPRAETPAPGDATRLGTPEYLPGAAAPAPGYAPGGIPAELNARLLEVYRRTVQRQHDNSVRTAVAALDHPRPATRMAEDARTLVEALVEASPARPQAECRAGCAWCCHQPVPVSAVEALAIASALRDRLPEAWRQDLEQALAARVAAIAPLPTLRDHVLAQIPCAFLSAGGTCGIYQERPVVCRGYLSLSRTACQEKYASLAAPAPPIDTAAHAAASGVLHGVMAASHAMHRDGRAFELHHAVLIALRTPDAEQRWARGEDVFAACRTSPPVPPDQGRSPAPAAPA